MRLFDAHCDTATKIFDAGEELCENTGHLSLKGLREGFSSAVQVFALWTEPIYYKNALERALSVIDYFYEQEEKNREIFGIVRSFSDIAENEKAGKISGILSAEGGEPFLGDTRLLRIFYRLGVRLLSLTWNYRNELAYGVNDSSDFCGLTEKGRQLVAEAERLGMALDVSHLSDKAFYDLAEIAQNPFIASHSNARAICPNPRNLTDNQIKIIAEKGGVIGLNLYPDFLSGKGEADINDVLRHAGHILSVGGENALGFGCDLDGIGYLPAGIENVSDVRRIADRFIEEFGKSLAEKIAYGNFLNFFEKILA